MTAQLVDDRDEIKGFAKPAVGKIWFAVCEDLFDHEVVGAKVKKLPWHPMMVWLWLIKEAARQNRVRVLQGKRIALRRGQVAVSLRYLARETNWSVKAVRRFLERLVRFEMIAVSVTTGTQLSLNFVDLAVPDLSDACPKRGTGVTIVTLCNYDKYQHAPAPRGTGRAQEGHRKGTGGAQDNTENIDTEEEKRVAFVAGKIALFGDYRAYWLGRFGGDEQGLADAIVKATPYIQPNGSAHTLEAKVSSQLTRQVETYQDRIKRAASNNVTHLPRRRMSPQEFAKAAGMSMGGEQ